jgi:hypothetical protein
MNLAGLITPWCGFAYHVLKTGEDSVVKEGAKTFIKRFLIRIQKIKMVKERDSA